MDGASFSWAMIQAPTGDVPMARQGHTACEVAASACIGDESRGGRSGLLIYGGEGTVKDGSEIRPTDSFEAFLYDPEVSCGNVFSSLSHNAKVA